MLVYRYSAILLVAFGVLAATSAVPAVAGSISYGNVAAQTVVYQNVTESSLDPLPLYGAPSVSGNSLQFTPPNFAAQSTNGTIDFVDGTLNTSIVANPNQGINTISVAEAGDFTLSGATAYATISAPIFLRIDDVNGAALISPIVYSTNLVFTPGSGGPGSYATPGDAGVGTIWTGSISVDLNAVLAANNMGGNVTQVQWTMDNSLTAYAPSGGISFIKKKDIGGVALTVQTGGIPEPSSVVLAALGFVGLLYAARKRM
jgi:hypothetical protein